VNLRVLRQPELGTEALQAFDLRGGLREFAGIRRREMAHHPGNAEAR
jgi:hypothetical protein